MERDTDLKEREQGAEEAALRETFGRTPSEWYPPPPPPPVSVDQLVRPQRLGPGPAPSEIGLVFSTWDVRPVNAYDIEPSFNYFIDGDSRIDQSVAYRVPLGYVLFVRSVSWYFRLVGSESMLDMPALNVPAQLTVGLFVDSVDVGLFPIQEPSPPANNNWMQAAGATVQAILPSIGIAFPAFAIAGGGSLVEFRSTIFFGLLNNVRHGRASIRGTLRLSRGIAANYEVRT